MDLPSGVGTSDMSVVRNEARLSRHEHSRTDLYDIVAQPLKNNPSVLICDVDVVVLVVYLGTRDVNSP